MKRRSFASFPPSLPLANCSSFILFAHECNVEKTRAPVLHCPWQLKKCLQLGLFSFSCGQAHLPDLPLAGSAMVDRSRIRVSGQRHIHFFFSLLLMQLSHSFLPLSFSSLSTPAVRVETHTHSE